jgi:hypothetical protein
MDINASIIDQQVRGLADRLLNELEDALHKKLDETRLRSAAFVLLCVKTILDLTDGEALELLTGNRSDPQRMG